MIPRRSLSGEDRGSDASEDADDTTAHDEAQL